ncbi:uncharacterized protein [Henckelia pumila]|uniref:uncharacterized protein n=1 Tax=Henckelia pumila TaxID=405737 RepID=UPI003C6E5238
MNEECSAVLQKKIPTKSQDPGSFSIPCIENIEPTAISLKFAEGFIKYPRGIVENILVKIDNLIYPVDFVILDMEDDSEVPLIFGCPFLAASRALIDVERGELVLRLNDEQVVFTMLKSATESPILKSCSAICLIDVIDVVGDAIGRTRRFI